MVGQPGASTHLPCGEGPSDRVERIHQHTTQLRERTAGGGRLRTHKQCASRKVMLAEQRRQSTTEPVANHSTADVLRDGESDFWSRCAVPDHDRQRPATHPNPVGGQPSEGAATPKRSRGGSHDVRPGARPQAERRARPLARRAFSTARPPAVDMRARKPCFFARRRSFGWNVRFTETSEMWPYGSTKDDLDAHGAEPENDSSAVVVDFPSPPGEPITGGRSGVVHRVLPCPPLTSADIRSSLRGRRTKHAAGDRGAGNQYP